MIDFAIESYNFLAIPFLLIFVAVTSGRGSERSGRIIRAGSSGNVRASWSCNRRQRDASRKPAPRSKPCY